MLRERKSNLAGSLPLDIAGGLPQGIDGEVGAANRLGRQSPAAAQCPEEAPSIEVGGGGASAVLGEGLSHLDDHAQALANVLRFRRGQWREELSSGIDGEWSKGEGAWGRGSQEGGEGGRER